MSDFDNWYDTVKHTVNYKSSKAAWDYQQAKVEELEAKLENAEGYLWDAADASQWEDYAINNIHHLKSKYTKEGASDE